MPRMPCISSSKQWAHEAAQDLGVRHQRKKLMEPTRFLNIDLDVHSKLTAESAEVRGGFKTIECSCILCDPLRPLR